LRDSGLVNQADAIQKEFLDTLGRVNFNGKSARNVAEKMLKGERIID
jgi:hypothetical protein